MSCIQTCMSKWKAKLLGQLETVNSNPMTDNVFIYKSERNTYLMSMLRTLSPAIRSSMEKIAIHPHLNQKIKKYFHKNGVNNMFKTLCDSFRTIVAEQE